MNEKLPQYNKVTHRLIKVFNDERPHQDLTDIGAVCWISLKCVCYQLTKVLREGLRKSCASSCALKMDKIQGH